MNNTSHNLHEYLLIAYKQDHMLKFHYKNIPVQTQSEPRPECSPVWCERTINVPLLLILHVGIST